jgi:hypothetical protein
VRASQEHPGAPLRVQGDKGPGAPLARPSSRGPARMGLSAGEPSGQSRECPPPLSPAPTWTSLMGRAHAPPNSMKNRSASCTCTSSKPDRVGAHCAARCTPRRGRGQAARSGRWRWRRSRLTAVSAMEVPADASSVAKRGVVEREHEVARCQCVSRCSRSRPRCARRCNSRSRGRRTSRTSAPLACAALRGRGRCVPRRCSPKCLRAPRIP